MSEKKITSLSYIGLLAQIRYVGLNGKEISNIILNSEKEKNALVRIALIVVELD